MDALGTSFEEALETQVPEELRGAVAARHSEDTAQTITRVRGVTAEGGPKPWSEDWDPADGFYWPRQREYLHDIVGRAPLALDSLDNDSDRVLFHLEDPRADGPAAFNTRGLVIGHVQSGKTENFTALIAKSFDLGYRFVVVLSGMHNQLRQQTQRRLDRELGLTTAPPGVGLPDPGRILLRLTTDALQNYVELGSPHVLQGNERVILVVTKVGRVLDRLIEFVQHAGAPSELPVLVIDDEADQASINTGGNRPPAAGDARDEGAEDEGLEDIFDDTDPDVDLADEHDPSKINAKIRTLVGLFQRVAYIGYTATPFANVLIDHRAEDREVYRDLFPEDFILTLPAKPGYVGASRLFGRDALEGNPEGDVEGLDVIRFIPDWEMSDLVPIGIPVDHFEPSVPESLEEAVEDWLLATGGVLDRAGADRPSTMLVHTSPRTRVQNELGPEIAAHVAMLRQEWRYGGDGLKRRLRERWDAEFRPVTVRTFSDRDRPFDRIESHIDRVMRDPIPVLVLNSTTEDQMDFDVDPNLKAIVVGGNQLSRGVTLEGLAVSYYVRRTPYYDTLLQMARWFGYREQIVDLTRLHTTEELASWFRDLALREEELRQQLQEAEAQRLTPLQAGQLIRSHPAMMVTAQNKMGAGRMHSLSYAGRMIQTSRFKLDDHSWLENNLSAVRNALEPLATPGADPGGTALWNNIVPEVILDLLDSYATVQDRTSFDAASAASYIRSQVEQEELTSWQIAVAAPANEDPVLRTIDLPGGPFNAVGRTRLKKDRASIGVLTNPARRTGPRRQGDEEIGLSDEQIDAARRSVDDGLHETIRAAVLAQRSKTDGLLVIYPISPRSQPRPNSQDRIPLFDDPLAAPEAVIGLAIAFPPSDSAATVEYIAGSVVQDADDSE